MKRINFNIKDRKVLMIGLCLIIVCVFTLTIAYAALNAALTIQGNAEVVASTWNIHLANPKVKSGSATTTMPTITSGRTLTFSTTFNMPGDFYEFTVDVVNAGTIDAMIDSVTKTPELTTDQAKYLKYEVSYANDENITTKQTITAGSTMPIKVRVEYRKDLSSTDLPTGQVSLSLSLTLNYIQSDGTGNTVKDNGISKINANGSLDTVGTIVTLGTEQFYVIGSDTENVTLLAMYNLYVGGVYNNGWTAYGSKATGLQDETMRGYVAGETIRNGTTAFSTTYDESGDLVISYIDSYKIKIEQLGISVVEARMVTYDELTNPDTFNCDFNYSVYACNSAYSWIYSTSYWTSGPNSCFSTLCGLAVKSDGKLDDLNPENSNLYGVRPVIVIPKSIF